MTIEFHTFICKVCGAAQTVRKTDNLPTVCVGCIQDEQNEDRNDAHVNP